MHTLHVSLQIGFQSEWNATNVTFKLARMLMNHLLMLLKHPFAPKGHVTYVATKRLLIFMYRHDMSLYAGNMHIVRIQYTGCSMAECSTKDLPKLGFWWNANPHSLHIHGRWPSWIFCICLSRWCFLKNLVLHKSQSKLAVTTESSSYTAFVRNPLLKRNLKKLTSFFLPLVDTFAVTAVGLAPIEARLFRLAPDTAEPGSRGRLRPDPMDDFGNALTDCSVRSGWCGGVWCGSVWCSGVWCGGVWCGGVWCGGVDTADTGDGIGGIGTGRIGERLGNIEWEVARLGSGSVLGFGLMGAGSDGRDVTGIETGCVTQYWVIWMGAVV